MIKYLDLKRINDLYDAEIREANTQLKQFFDELGLDFPFSDGE